MKTRAAYIMMVMLLLGAGFFFCRPAIADIYYADPSGHFDANAMGVGNTVIETPSATSGDCSSETYSSCRASATPVKLNVPAFNIAVGTQCKYITVNNGKTVFIPARTSNEWKSFMDWAGNPLRNGGQVDLHGCSDGMWTVWSGCSPACGPLAGTQNRLCVYTSNWKGNNCSALDAWGSSRACADYSTCVCAAKDANSTFCAGSDSGFTAMPPPVTYVNLGGCDGTKCQAACVANYHTIAGGCAINTCAPLTANATACNALTPPAHNQSYTLVAACSASPCLATCNSGYFRDGAVCNITPVCGASPNTCSAGAPSGYDGPKACGGSVENWTCSSGSASIACTSTTAACPSCGGSANTCAVGSPTSYNADVCGGTSTWTCVSGAFSLGCSKANAACPTCGGSNNTCGVGSPAGYSAGVCGGSATWNCNNGGYTQACSNGNAACPICGASNNTCNLGSPSGYSAGVCDGSSSWTCSNGGYNTSCGNPNPANPTCGGSNNTCGIGTPSGYALGACGGSATWTCSNATCTPKACSNPNPAVPTCGGSSNTCGIGTPSGYSAGGCGGSATWSCDNSWCSSQSCSNPNAACPVCGGSANTCSTGSPSGYDGPKACGGLTENWTCTNGGSSTGCTKVTGACAGCTFSGTWGGGCSGSTSAAHGATGTATDSTGSETGWISATCNNGTWTGVSSYCQGPYTLGAYGSCSPCRTRSLGGGSEGTRSRSVTCSYDACTGDNTSIQCCIASDCPVTCGDGSCNGETIAGCPADCGYYYCGDGSCNAPENPGNCLGDCPTSCGDGYCVGSEVCDGCIADCGACPPPPD